MDNGFTAPQLLAGGYKGKDLKKAGFTAEDVAAAKLANANAAQQTVTASSSSANSSDTTAAVIVAVIILLLVVGVAIAVVAKRKTNEHDATAFSNPMYDTSQAPGAGPKQGPTYDNSGYMVPAGQSTTGYMDVAPNGAAPVMREDFGGFHDANSEDV